MRPVSLREFRTRVTDWRERTKGLTNILASPVGCPLIDLAIWRQSRTTAVETRVCQDCIVGSLTIAGVVSSCPLTTGMLLRNSISTFYGHSSRPMM
jgi:hypothetical protein